MEDGEVKGNLSLVHMLQQPGAQSLCAAVQYPHTTDARLCHILLQRKGKLNLAMPGFIGKVVEEKACDLRMNNFHGKA